MGGQICVWVKRGMLKRIGGGIIFQRRIRKSVARHYV